MTSFRGEVVSGNSGGPVIDGDGRVLATVFASALGSDRPEGLGVPNAVTSRVLERARGSGETGTGPCT
jgi:S1-C subfamily serine protease